MRLQLCCAFYIYLFFTLVICRKSQNWEGKLLFHDDFDGFQVQKDHWTYEEWCHGKGSRDTNLECFATSDDNVRVFNGTLIMTAAYQPLRGNQLYVKPKNFTSARLKTTGNGFSHGTFVVSARLPKGKFLAPSVWLMPGLHQNHANCKYEEIEIVQARGEKTSNLIFSASFGRQWNSVAAKRMEKVFPGVDFSESFHEFAIVWKPQRIDWFVDGIKVFTASTYFYSDWILSDETNVPCSSDKSLFQQPLQLALSMSVGGNMFAHYEHPLTMEEARLWEKPTFEIDWVKVYQSLK